jgi:hypothetical protein
LIKWSTIKRHYIAEAAVSGGKVEE